MFGPAPQRKTGPGRPGFPSTFNLNAARSGNQSLLHQQLIAKLGQLGLNGRFRILAAALSGFPEPVKHGRHEPDLVFQDSSGLIHLGEAKTGNGDLETSHTREQFWDFSHRTHLGRAVPFHIAVPASARWRLESVLIRLGIRWKSNVFIYTF